MSSIVRSLGMDQGPQGPSGRKGAIGSVSSRAKFQELRHWCIASKLFTTGAFVWEKRSNFHAFQSESLTTAILETLVTQTGVRRFLSFSNTYTFPAVSIGRKTQSSRQNMTHSVWGETNLRIWELIPSHLPQMSACPNGFDIWLIALICHQESSKIIKRQSWTLMSNPIN